MNTLYRLLVMIPLIALSSLPLLVNAGESLNMQAPKGLKVIQNTIEKNAEQHGISVRVEWSATKDQSFTATISYENIKKQVVFTPSELENASKNDIAPETTDKIEKLISQLPGRHYPPGIKP